MKKTVLALNFVLLLAIIALDIVFILSPGLVLKSITSACFVLAGIVSTVYALKAGAEKRFVCLMLTGLVLAMAGDVVNYNTADAYFISGTALFAVAHVFYAAAYFCLNKFHYTDLIAAACIFVPSALFITLAPIFDFGGVLMEIVCVVYAFILSVMVGKALSNLKMRTALSVLIAVGSVLFYVSDLSLLLNMFGKIRTVPRILCLATYYPAQFMLAFAIFESAVKGVNTFKAFYCRLFQTVLKIALPVLPYKDPEIVSKIEDIPQTLKKNAKCKPLIVTDKTIYGLGLCKGLEQSLKSAGLSYCVFSEVVANPTTDNVAAAVKTYKTGGCDCLIAFGGGSPMDCAKGAGALIARPKKQLSALRGILKVIKKIPLLIAIPTTAGTGSETTLACVIVDSGTRYKYAVNDFPLIPSYAVLDEEVTMTLPGFVVSTTGMDALTHAVEAYIGKSGNRSTRADALDAVKTVFENLEVSFSEGTREARKNMLIASHKAGRAFSKAYVGYVHAVAHSLGGKYDTPHGLANAVLLPIVLREYGNSVHKKLKEIAVYCNLAAADTPADEAAERVISKIEQMNATFAIPSKFDFIKKEDIDGLAAHAEKEANPLYPVPVLWDREKLKQIYLKAGIYAD
ncbi:MAG: iron-containing alcohol dehydrogenase [Clostridia bacterium]|nr:iron-containing alcohol dehydrogenase [Clostridia bacterium]